MTVVFTKEKRSEIMSKVRSKGNVAKEKKLIELFKTHSIKGWRSNYPLFGKLDFVFTKKEWLYLLTVSFSMDIQL